MENKMNEMINWDFAPKQGGYKSTKEFHLSVYYNPNKKSATYTIQVHFNAPKKIQESECVTFGKMNGKIVLTNQDKGNSYTIHKYEGSKSSQINGKGLCQSIIEHFGLDAKENQILRLKLTPIGEEDMRLWSINLYSVEPK